MKLKLNTKFFRKRKYCHQKAKVFKYITFITVVVFTKAKVKNHFIININFQVAACCYLSFVGCL